MNWLDVLLGFMGGGGLVTVITIPFIIKKASADARSAELDNLQKAVEGWRQLADERQEANNDKDEQLKAKDTRIDELNVRIDSLYVVNGEWRDKYNFVQSENANLRVKIATDEMKLCMMRGCQSREPQSGY